MNDRVQRLEEKVAYLERHVTEQDKAMLELTETLSRLRLELRKLRDRLADTATGEGAGEPADERPPHY
jgi:SlyX protein